MNIDLELSATAHHVVKRAQGGSNFDLDWLVALCSACHDRTDAPYSKGRLVITPEEGGGFRIEVVRREGKRADPATASPGVPTVQDLVRRLRAGQVGTRSDSWVVGTFCPLWAKSGMVGQFSSRAGDG